MVHCSSWSAGRLRRSEGRSVFPPNHSVFNFPPSSYSMSPKVPAESLAKFPPNAGHGRRSCLLVLRSVALAVAAVAGSIGLTKAMSVGRNFGHPKLTRPRGQMYCPSTEMVSSL